MSHIEERKIWAERFPNEDTYGSLIIGWLIKKPELFDTDVRLQDISIFQISKGWKVLLLAARSYHRKHGAITFSTINKEIWRHKKLDDNFKNHLIDLVKWAQEVIEHTSVDDYEDAMRQVWEQTRKQKVYDGMMSATKEMYNEDFESGLDSALETIEMARAMGETKSAGLRTMAELSKLTQQEYGSSRGAPMATGFLRVDMATLGGMRRGQQWILAGFASHGKTAAAKEIAYASVIRGHNVSWTSLEMSIPEIRTLFTVRHTHAIKKGGVALADVLEDKLDGEDKEVYFEAAKQWAEKGGMGERLHIWVPDQDITADDVVRRVEAEHRRKPIDLLVVDYSELLVPLRRRQQYRIELGDTIRRLKTAAGGFGRGEGIAVLLLHQTSRKGLERAEKRGYYVMSDLAETAMAERSADVILWVLRTDDMKVDHELLIGISKQRMGPQDLYKGCKVYENFSHAFIGNILPQGTTIVDN